MEDYERHLTEQGRDRKSAGVDALIWAGKIALAVLAVALVWHIVPVVIAALADPLAGNPY